MSGRSGNCWYKVSFSSQMLLLSFYIILKPMYNFLFSLHFLYYSFCSYILSFNAFVLCCGSLVEWKHGEAEPDHRTI